jgi:L-threonylcarbamoyladenylate synthase
MTLTLEDAHRLEGCVRAGGVAIFPSDTVYGVCCDPENEDAVARLYALKGRPAERAAAVMFFARERALGALPELAAGERAAAESLLPGPVTLLLRNPAHRFAAACGRDRETLGLRVPALAPAVSELVNVTVPVMQSSANLSGGTDARRLEDVAAELREGADLVLDAGALPGVPSTVVDLRGHEPGDRPRVLRAGAVSEEELLAALGSAR